MKTVHLRWITGNPKREFFPRLVWPAVVHEQIILAGQPKYSMHNISTSTQIYQFDLVIHLGNCI